MSETRVEHNARKRRERLKRMENPEDRAWLYNTAEYRRAHESPQARENRMERSRRWGRETLKRDRESVYAHYGSSCSCCGEALLDFLTIDHINGNGAKHRKTLDAPNIYTWLVRNNYPEGYRVLCFNCNCVATRVEVCPHNAPTPSNIETGEAGVGDEGRPS